MGFFDKSFGRKNKTGNVNIPQQQAPEKKPSVNEKDYFSAGKRGTVYTQKINLDEYTLASLKQRYIAFDVETTGLSSYQDRIIEVGAVLFENGAPVKKYGTLVNAGVYIPASATSVNHITNQMISNAPSENEVYANLVEFMGDVLTGKTAVCAHNAKFDMNFLSAALERLGYDAKIKYVDTLSLSRNLVKGLKNYKQDTVASHFQLFNQNAHRAESDAETCGAILWSLLEIKKKETELREEKVSKKQKKQIAESGKSNTPKRNGRPVLRMDDEMNVLERYKTLSEAVRKTGINSKSIRDAAKGVQKHAGTFVWRYEDEYMQSSEDTGI